MLRNRNKEQGQWSLTWVQCAKVKSHFKKHINGPWKPEARNLTRLNYYACPGYQQLWWWFDQKWTSYHGDSIFPLYVYGKFFGRSRTANSVVNGPIWPKFELVRDLMHVLVTCKLKKDRIKKQPRKGGDIDFPIISQWGLSPIPVMLHIKFDQDWPTGFRDIQVWKCGRRRRMTADGRTTDHWYTISSLCEPSALVS